MVQREYETKPSWTRIRPEGRMLRPKEVADRLGLSRSQIYEMIARGEFPPFVKLSARASALPESWLSAFLTFRTFAFPSNQGPGDREFASRGEVQ